MSENLALDLLRLTIFVLYGATIGYVFWIIRLYAKRAGRLLPQHILTVGVMFLLALTESAYQNASRVGEDFSWYIPSNLLLMFGSLFAMRRMKQHLHRRHESPDTTTPPQKD